MNGFVTGSRVEDVLPLCTGYVERLYRKRGGPKLVMGCLIESDELEMGVTVEKGVVNFLRRKGILTSSSDAVRYEEIEPGAADWDDDPDEQYRTVFTGSGQWVFRPSPEALAYLGGLSTGEQVKVLDRTGDVVGMVGAMVDALNYAYRTGHIAEANGSAQYDLEVLRLVLMELGVERDKGGLNSVPTVAWGEMTNYEMIDALSHYLRLCNNLNGGFSFREFNVARRLHQWSKDMRYRGMEAARARGFNEGFSWAVAGPELFGLPDAMFASKGEELRAKLGVRFGGVVKGRRYEDLNRGGADERVDPKAFADLWFKKLGAE